jgi:hypothetical protein
MTIPIAGVETQLCLAYDEEIQRYQSACELAADLVECLQQGRADQGKMQKLVSLLDEIAVIEARIDSIKDDWRRRGEKPGTQLQEKLQRVATHIQHLIAQIHRAEQAAQLHKSRLVPQLDAAGRAQQMQRAYQLWR